MQKTALSKAVVMALATLGVGVASAQSSVTLYGNLDVAVDNDHKSAGNAQGNLAPAVASSYNPKSTLTRVTSSVSSTNQFGVKGTEDLGGGYKTDFVLEGQFQVDTGAQSGQDSRMWGRQAFVGLTTPGGQVRLGRQYAPMFYLFATDTVDALGGADIQGFGLVVNNLQIRQDNQISYWLKAGDLSGAVSYSPNAGVDSAVSKLRQPATTGGAAGGEIIGGQFAGTETANSGGRGQTVGLFVNYQVDPALLVNFGYHANKFGNAVLCLTSSSASCGITLANLDSYHSWALGAKYTVPGVGTQFSAILHEGTFKNDAGDNDGPKVQTLTFGFRQPVGDFSLGGELGQSKFTNFTKGKDLGLMFIGDYNFSKRTKVYTRIGMSKDSPGSAAAVGSTAACAAVGSASACSINGGPLPLLTGFGSVETPLFSAAGANIDSTTRMVAVGIRHQF